MAAIDDVVDEALKLIFEMRFRISYEAELLIENGDDRESRLEKVAAAGAALSELADEFTGLGKEFHAAGTDEVRQTEVMDRATQERARLPQRLSDVKAVALAS
ncbi:hypothetical protein ACFV2Q_31140 [Streptomyces sp. NPDC059650]|uniref:hypothetical protein n=1 Tax=Streptomyces sp. NPDC059650 TaxID=3346896 RepID=UPI0036C9AF57